MRGGAIPPAALGTLLLALFIGNLVWNDKPVNAAPAGFAALVIYAIALALWLARREALRRGAPAPRELVEAVPQASSGAVLAGLAVGATLFGLVWARFLVIFGVGLLLLALGRIVVEVRSERRSRRGPDGGSIP
ncbi:MAG: hypothetical protein M3Z27_04470 [Actinomycetota bacterium]|nr:hypothetical protein [Actinomycetota bacterium]